MLGRPIQHLIHLILRLVPLLFEPIFPEQEELFDVHRSFHMRRLRCRGDHRGTQVSPRIAERLDSRIGLPFHIFGEAEAMAQLSYGRVKREREPETKPPVRARLQFFASSSPASFERRFIRATCTAMSRNGRAFIAFN